MSGDDDRMPVWPDLQSVVQQPSTPEQIAEHILSAIVVGALPEGTALPPERQLASSLAVSRSSVRLALAELEEQGVLERRRGRTGGTFIRPLHEAKRRMVSSGELDTFFQARLELLDARAMLARVLTQTAAERRDDADIARIRAAQREHAAQHESGAARAADGRFHLAIAEAAGNGELSRFAVDLDSRINLGFRHDPFSAALHAAAVRHHERMAEAIAVGDAAEAGRVAEEHFRATTGPGAAREGAEDS